MFTEPLIIFTTLRDDFVKCQTCVGNLIIVGYGKTKNEAYKNMRLNCREMNLNDI
jgi:hypothetical protein